MKVAFERPGWGRSRRTMGLYHYREHSGAEVDALWETTDGRIVVIGIKATATVRAKDIRQLKQMQDRIGPRSIGGLILYSGPNAIPLQLTPHRRRRLTSYVCPEPAKPPIRSPCSLARTSDP